MQRFDITDQAFDEAVEEMEVPQNDEHAVIFTKQTEYSDLLAFLTSHSHIMHD